MIEDGTEFDAVPFDLFGTLVTVGRPDEPAESIATALEEQGVSVPDDSFAHNLGGNSDRLLHVGDDPTADGGASDLGATTLLADSVPLTDVPDVVEGRE